MDIATIKRKIHTLFSDKRIFHKKLVGSRIYKYLPDKLAVKLIYHNIFGRKLDLNNPQTFNEKLQWLKIYDHNPKYTALVDKISVKEIVAKIIGAKYIIPTFGIYNSFDEIDFEALPDQFVIKTNHGGGNTGVVICKNKARFDINAAKEKINNSLASDTYIASREWPYKNIKRKILIEQYMDEDGNPPKDYKFFCFDGEVKCLFVGTERYSEEVKFDFFDTDFKHLPIVNGHPWSIHPIKKPENFEEMKRIAAILSKGYPFMRVDLYEISGKIYFGEYTLYHFGASMPIEPIEWDYKLGSWLRLPEKTL